MPMLSAWDSCKVCYNRRQKERLYEQIVNVGLGGAGRSVEAYVKELGFTDADIKKFCNIMFE